MKMNFQKKILLIMTNITTKNMRVYLQQIGYEVTEWMAPCEGDSDKCGEALADALDDSYYGAFSYDYFPQFAQACYERNKYYIAWVVDNPHFSLWSKTVKYPTNRIFVFDNSQCGQLEKRGVEKLFYLPLGADVDAFSKVDYSNQDFTADVAFVGSLYNEDSRNLFQQIKFLPPYTRGYVEGLIRSQLNLSENILNKDMISNSVWQDIKRYVNLSQVNSYDFSYEECFVHILQKEVTKRERCQAVTLLNKFFDFKLYSASSTEFNPELKKAGYVNYETQMPLVFRQSRVNINITLRSITTGIPLRALDIMACGGFLLSNYQVELAEYFEEDKECVFYYDLEDMVMKTDYYLKHEEERRKIAEAGLRKVQTEFSLKGQLSKMKAMLEENE